MEKKNGITLVALIITIIMMLILAGVAISALVGDESIIGKARNTANEYNQGAMNEKEEMDKLLSKIEEITDEEAKQLEKVLKNASELPMIDGQDMILESKSYKITEAKDVTNFSIKVPSGVEAKLYICGETTINNTQNSKSGIDIQPNGKLELYIYAKTQLDSGEGIKGKNASPSILGEGGAGGYAGIHVPQNATIAIFGNSTIYAYGGDAGDGGNTVSTTNAESSGGSGGGAGAGIGGNGGKGGQSKAIGSANNRVSIAPEPGESAGDIYINDSVTVYAYGGSGGSGGDTATGKDSGGSGGYPAAGIGGGGAGGGGSAGSGGDGGGRIFGSSFAR